MMSDELKQVDVRLKLVEGNGVYSDKPITNPQEAISVMADVMAGLDREEVCVINLDSKGHPINFNVVSIGTLNSSFVSGRELFKSAILSNAASMILLHNHPSSELQMSQSDRMVTEKMMYASLFLDIEILDHIIVAGRTGDTLSIRETYPEIFDKSTYVNAIVRVADGVEERENSYDAEGLATYELFQIKEGGNGQAYQFMGMDFVKKNKLVVDKADYESVYRGEIKEGETLDTLYEKFNLYHPDDFTGHSMSVSDVIVIEKEHDKTAYQMIMKKYMANERSINREQEMKNENGDYSTNINYERRKQQRDTEEMLDRISSFDERLLYVGITIVVKADSMEELEERTEKIKIIGQTHNMDIVPHSHKQLDALNTSLPTGARFVDTMRTITSEELSIFIPFNVQEINDNQGYCYGFNKVSKNLIIGNRKLLKNGNGMVFGVPGSGKSYNEKSEMGQVLCFSTDDIIVIDPMSEYKDIAAAWGGQYINLSQSAENVYYVNPFHVPDVVPDIDRFVAEKAEFAYAICEQALKPTPLTSRHIAVIDKAVRDMYSEYFKKKNDRRRKRKTRLESPTIRTMRDGIAERSEGNDSAIELVEQLEVFADGTLDIFAREQSISEENRFTVYGFSELGKRMRAMAMLVMIESITAKIKYNQSDGVATWVYVDEMHELWGEEYSLHALEKMWREVRKRGGICTGMSQNLIDAQRNRSTKTMVSNSEFMLLLDQGTMDKEAVEDLFDISAEQLACVNGADPGMGLIRFGDKIVPFDNTMKKDSELYQLFNTNFHEIAGATR